MTEEKHDNDNNADKQQRAKSAGNTGFRARRRVETEKHDTGCMFELNKYHKWTSEGLTEGDGRRWSSTTLTAHSSHSAAGSSTRRGGRLGFWTKTWRVKWKDLYLQLTLCLFSAVSGRATIHHLRRVIWAQSCVTDECRWAEDNGGQHFPPLSAAQRRAKIRTFAWLFSLTVSDHLSILTLLIMVCQPGTKHSEAQLLLQSCFND